MLATDGCSRTTADCRLPIADCQLPKSITYIADIISKIPLRKDSRIPGRSSSWETTLNSRQVNPSIKIGSESLSIGVTVIAVSSQVDRASPILKPKVIKPRLNINPRSG